MEAAPATEDRMDEAVAAAAMIKRRRPIKRPRPTAASSAARDESVDDNDDGNGDDNDRPSALQVRALLAKERAVSRAASKASATTLSSSEVAGAAVVGATFALRAAEAMDASLGTASFTHEQTSSARREPSALEQNMRSYVEARLAEKGLAERSEPPAPASSARPDDADLYAVPESLQRAMLEARREAAQRAGVALHPAEVVARAPLASDDGSATTTVSSLSSSSSSSSGPAAGDSNALAWNTGIAEVALPAEYRLANVAQTEAAKREFIAKLRAEQERRDTSFNGFGRFSAGSITVNFDTHRRTGAIQAQIKSLRSRLYTLADELERATALHDEAEVLRARRDMDAIEVSLRDAVTRASAADTGGLDAGDGNDNDDADHGGGRGSRGPMAGILLRTQATDDDLMRRFRSAYLGKSGHRR